MGKIKINIKKEDFVRAEMVETNYDTRLYYILKCRECGNEYRTPSLLGQVICPDCRIKISNQRAKEKRLLKQQEALKESKKYLKKLLNTSFKETLTINGKKYVMLNELYSSLGLLEEEG